MQSPASLMFLPGEEPAAFLKEALEDLRRLHGLGAGGRELARRRADMVDLTLISLFRGAEHQLLGAAGYREPGLAVVAVGGYGRRELCPASDVDLMLLYRPEESARVQEMAERLFYPLWDAALELGHGARTVDECLELAAENVDLETSLLQARLLVGDQELFRSLTDRLRDLVSDDGGRSFMERLLAAREARRQEHGPAGALLEPDLKEGRGGLRDVHEVLWAAAALHGTTGLDGLAGTGWLPTQAIAALEAAIDVLLWARTSLHYVTGRRLDRLHLDYQEDVAALSPGPDGQTVEAVMARVFSAAQTVGFLTEDGWSGAAREVGLSLAVSTRVPAPLPETPQGRRVLLTELLREGPAGVARLERLSHAGVLSDWLPGWDAIRSLGQRDSLHTYTVDGHSLRCSANAVQLARAGDADPVASAVAAELSLSPLWEGFLLACLLHDLGKGGEGDHARRGARLAAEVAAALGESAEVQADIDFLVREHLLLPDTATRRDLDDPILLEWVADRVGSRERLKMLYLLTIADARATGPAVRTPWRATLVQELFLKVLALLDGRAERPAEAAGPSMEEGEPRWAPEHPPGERLLSMAVLLPAGGALTLELHATHLPDVEELSVVSPPQPGLLTRLSGVLAIHGITIMSAQLQPQADGRIARTFHVADYFGGSIPRERWERVRRDVASALEGRLGLEHRLAQKAARYPRSASLERQEAARVVLENGVSESLTVIEVHTADRIGLLYTIARTLDDLLLDVRLAKVSTLKERVVDVFYVADAHGDKLLDVDHLREVEQAILFALERES